MQKGLTVWCSTPIIEIREYSRMDIYLFFTAIHKFNCNIILVEWYNWLDCMKNGCEIKTIETQSCVIWETKFHWKTQQCHP